MSDLAFKARITKRKFETQLVSMVGMEDISSTPYEEDFIDDNGIPTVAHMTLYYKDGVHVGTWQKGKGWIFQSAVEDAA